MPHPDINSEQQQADFKDRLEILKKENEELKKQLNFLEEIYEFQAHKIAAKAQDNFTGWLRNSALGISVAAILGVLALSNITIDYIKTEGVKQSVDKIVQGEGKEKLRDSIVEKAIKDLEPQIKEATEKTVNSAVKEAVAQANLEARIGTAVDTAVNKIAEDIKKSNPSNEFVEVVETSVGEEQYLLVAGSSTESVHLQEEKQRIKEANSGQLPPGLTKVKVCPPKADKQRYALVIGDPVPLDKAKKMVQLAIANNFQTDTYPIRQSDAFFTYNASCN